MLIFSFKTYSHNLAQLILHKNNSKTNFQISMQNDVTNVLGFFAVNNTIHVTLMSTVLLWAICELKLKPTSH